MAGPLKVKRILKEDFERDMQDAVDKLAYPINSFSEQVRTALDGNLDFNNLNQQVININVAVDADGVPIILTQYKSTLKTRVIGHTCIAANNLTVPQNTATSQPFISSFTQNGDIMKVNKITGLVPQERYVLTFIAVGANIPT